jgi:hypothetical protein
MKYKSASDRLQFRTELYVQYKIQIMHFSRRDRKLIDYMFILLWCVPQLSSGRQWQREEQYSDLQGIFVWKLSQLVTRKKEMT